MKRKLEPFKEEVNLFFEAIKDNDIDAIQRMLAEDPGLANTINDLGNTALSYALSKKRQAIAKILVVIGADLNTVSSRKNSILQQALSSRANNLVVEILERNSLEIGEGYDINFFILDRSPELLSKTLYKMILKSSKSLKTLLSAKSFNRVSSSLKLRKNLFELFGSNPSEAIQLTKEELNERGLKGEQEGEETEKKIEAIEENNTEIVAIEESINSYAGVRDPLVAVMRNQGYELEEVPRDGNCFFTAIAVSIYRNLNPVDLNRVAADFRKAATEHMMNNLRNFVDYFENRENLHWYIERLAIEGEEADHIIIQALSDAMGREFIIHRGGSICIIHPRGEGAYDFVSHIFYDGRHYDGLARLDYDRRIEYRLDNPSREEGMVDDPDIAFALEILFEEDEVIEKYENLLSEEWFLSNIEEMSDGLLDKYIVDEMDYMVETGIAALYFFMPDKFEGHI